MRQSPLPQRDRPGRTARHAHLRRHCGHRDDPTRARWLRPLHPHYPRSSAEHALRPPRLAARAAGRRRCRGTTDRPHGVDRQQYRAAPPFRGAHRRRSGRSAPASQERQGRWWLAQDRYPSPARRGGQGGGLQEREKHMVNRVILVGRLTRDPEIVVSPKGLTIAKLRLATNSYSKDDDGNRQEDVQYHSLVAFDRLASICQEFLTRGKLIYAEGRLRSHEWDGKDGLRRYTTEVVMDQMKMLSPKAESVVDNGQPVAEPVSA